MSTADEVRSILRETGVPLTRRQIIDMLPVGCSDQAAQVFLSDAKKRGELETVMEDGKAAYRFASDAASPNSKPRKAAKQKSRGAKSIDDKTATPSTPENDSTSVRPETPARCDTHSGERERSSLAELVGYTEAALQAYVESVVDRNLYGFLLNARDAAKREFERAQA